jgi:uncharacterized OB-fold protein
MIQCKKCGKLVPKLLPRGFCVNCYKKVIEDLAEAVEKENSWQGRLYDKDGEPL